MSTRLKIVYCLIDSSRVGGIERSVCCKANYLADAMGYDVTIITTDGEGKTPFFDFSPRIHFVHLGINYDELDRYPFLKRITSQLQKRKKHKVRLTAVLKQLRADVVISTCTHEVSILWRIQDGSRKIAESHLSKDHKKIEVRLNNQSGWSKLFTLAADFRRKRSLRHYDTLVVLSEAERKRWAGYNAHIEVIPNPLPFAPNVKNECTSKRVMSAGRLSKEKGFRYLIEAWQMVTQQHPDWQLAIYGSGSEYENLIQQIADRRLTNVATIYPPVRDISTAYLASSVYVLPSVDEAFGMVLLEAMVCGLPCVAFATPGASEIVQEGETGFLVETKNTHRLAQTIVRLIDDETLRKRMGEKAQVYATRFSPEKIMSRWVDLFERN